MDNFEKIIRKYANIFGFHALSVNRIQLEKFAIEIRAEQTSVVARKFGDEIKTNV